MNDNEKEAMPMVMLHALATGQPHAAAEWLVKRAFELADAYVVEAEAREKVRLEKEMAK